MVKQKKSIVLMARVLVLALLIGVFASVPSEQTFAAANKALRSKVVFNGDKESDAAWMNNNYVIHPFLFPRFFVQILSLFHKKK